MSAPKGQAAIAQAAGTLLRALRRFDASRPTGDDVWELLRAGFIRPDGDVLILTAAGYAQLKAARTAVAS